MSTEDEYPEHQKLKAVKPQSQAIGEFIDWLVNTKGIALTVRHEHTESCQGDDVHVRCGYSRGEHMLTHETPRSLLAEFFEIDEEKLETEKLAMLAKMRGDDERSG